MRSFWPTRTAGKRRVQMGGETGTHHAVAAGRTFGKSKG